MKGLLPIIRKGHGCDYHRVYLPLQVMGYDFDTYHKAPAISSFDGIEIVFYNRTPMDSIDLLLAHKKKYGFKLVVDIDDSWELNANHLLYNMWRKSDVTKTITMGLAAADAVICTTARLAGKVKEFNKNVHVIPNALPFGEGQFNSDFNPCTGKSRFIYAGSSTHQWDLRLLMNPFQKLAQENLPAQFILAGYDDSNEPSKKLWDKMERDFHLNGRIKDYVRKNSLSIDDYMSHYMDADVSLVPLETNIFTPFKSNLKLLEAGCKNIPAIASNTPPYSDEVNCEALMSAGNTHDWYTWIKWCIKNPYSAKEKGEELGEYVRNNYDLRTVNVYREQLFNHLKTK